MNKKALASGLLSVCVFVAVASVRVDAQSAMSLSDLVKLFISIGIISPDQAATAEQAAAEASTAPTQTFTANLSLGSSGSEVVALQKALNISPATGYFGAKTQAAVIAYQSAHSIPATGYVGPLTRATLNSGTVSTAYSASSNALTPVSSTASVSSATVSAPRSSSAAGGSSSASSGGMVSGGAASSAPSAPAQAQTTATQSSSAQTSTGSVQTSSVQTSAAQTPSPTVTAASAVSTDLASALTQNLSTIDLRSMTGAYTLSKPVTISRPNTTILLGNTTINMSGLAASQSPFSSYILVTADNVTIQCDPSGRTVFQNGSNSQGNAITFLEARGGAVKNCVLDGDKSQNTAQADDTFQSGIVVIASSDRMSGTANAQTAVTDNTIKNWMHYGIQLYGDRSGGSNISGNDIESNGLSSDPQSTGVGVYLNKGSSANVVSGNTIRFNKLDGIRDSSAGSPVSNTDIESNTVTSNGRNGILMDESADIFSVPNVGQTGFTINGNTLSSNAVAGIRVTALDNTGLISGGKITNNTIASNGQWGAIFQSYSGNVNNISLTGNTITSNGAQGIAVGATTKLISASNNTLSNNNGGGAQIMDLGSNDSITVPTQVTTLPFGVHTAVSQSGVSTDVYYAYYNADQNAAIVTFNGQYLELIPNGSYSIEGLAFTVNSLSQSSIGINVTGPNLSGQPDLGSFISANSPAGLGGGLQLAFVSANPVVNNATVDIGGQDAVLGQGVTTVLGGWSLTPTRVFSWTYPSIGGALYVKLQQQ